jgi:L-fuculose-phosphate aldolase
MEMLLQEERQKIVDYGKKLLSSQLTTAFGGNLSIFNRELNLVAIKPSGVDYTLMSPEDVVVVTPQGQIADGALKPSSELRFHLALYQVRADVKAVVHTHRYMLPQSPASTANFPLFII